MQPKKKEKKKGMVVDGHLKMAAKSTVSQPIWRNQQRGE
jgi:hypothetical protein